MDSAKCPGGETELEIEVMDSLPRPYSPDLNPIEDLRASKSRNLPDTPVLPYLRHATILGLQSRVLSETLKRAWPDIDDGIFANL